MRACIKVLTPNKLFSSSLLFFLSEIRELSVRGRPERGWSRRDHAVHDARGRARRQVMMRFIFRRSHLSRLNLSLSFPSSKAVSLSLSLCDVQKRTTTTTTQRANRESTTPCVGWSRRRRFSKSARDDDAKSPPGTNFGCLKEKLKRSILGFRVGT